MVGLRKWAVSSADFPFHGKTGAGMQRTILILASLIVVAAASSSGCRSCDNCYDYSPPVANCGCNSCGTQRAGSASAGQVVNEVYGPEEVVEATR
jgi:hypothetical protein